MAAWYREAFTRGIHVVSAAVREAHAAGYTASHPRDDLNGLDAARKALILARELGLAVDLADVLLEPFVPPATLAHGKLDDFFAALEAEDDEVTRRVDALRAEGQVLRYLARIEPGDPTEGRPPVIWVGPIGVDAGHPAARRMCWRCPRPCADADRLPPARPEARGGRRRRRDEAGWLQGPRSGPR
jgi:hypothetical protein